MPKTTEIIEIRNPRQLPDYDHMIDELQAIIVETETEARDRVIAGYHELGTRLIEFKLDKPEFLPQVAQDIKKSIATIYKVLQFVKRWANLQDFYDEIGGDKRISWHAICNKYLTNGKEDKGLVCSIPYEQLVLYIFENANYLADKALYTKRGVTIRISEDQIDKYLEAKETGSSVAKAAGNLIEGSQKLANKYNSKVSIGFEGKEVVLAEPEEKN